MSEVFLRAADLATSESTAGGDSNRYRVTEGTGSDRGVGMEIEQVEVSQLRPNPQNPRQHPEKAIEKLVSSIEEYGFTNPILAQKKSKVVMAGHARLKAAEKAGLTKVPVVFLNWDDNRALAYNIADNKLQENSDWDFSALADALLELDNLPDVNLEITGFDMSEIQQIMEWTPEGKEKYLEGPTDLEFRILVDCDSEKQQKTLVEQFEKQGLKCRLVMS